MNLPLSDIRIALIGLGYVGLPLAVEFGKKLPVLGFDINPARIAELQSGQDHTLEVSPEDLREAAHLRFSADAADLATCNFFIITVPTPIDEHKQPDLTPLIKASETIGKVLKRGDLVVYESTVYPGATEEVCVPVLEKHSGLKFRGVSSDASCEALTLPPGEALVQMGQSEEHWCHVQKSYQRDEPNEHGQKMPDCVVREIP